MLLIQKLSFVVVFFVTILLFVSSSHAMDMVSHMNDMFMVGSFQLVQKNGEPLSHASVTLGHQTRITNTSGKVEFEDIPKGPNKLQIMYKNRFQEVPVEVIKESTLVAVSDTWTSKVNSSQPVTTDQAQAQNLLITMAVVLICFGMAIVLIKKRHMLVKKKTSKKMRHSIISAFLVLGLFSTLLTGYQLTQLATKNTIASAIFASEVNTIPMPANLKAYGDDRVATITWDAPSDAPANKIIGYVVRWGKKSDGVLTDSKQTVYTQTQIQPLENGVEYIVAVQSVTGTYNSAFTKDGHTFEGTFAVAEGNYSPPVQTTVTGSSARVDAMRQRLTGFFDDFNKPAGNFDELKWNTAYTACSDPGGNGAFINSQFHAHNQVRARPDDNSPSGLPYCDRAATTSRPRAIFDVSAATDANPALIEMDADGVARHRDAWYIDLIPLNARTNGIPVDLEAHDSIFQDDSNEPSGILRIVENNESLMILYWDQNRKPQTASVVSLNCPSWQGDRADLNGCNVNNKVTKYSPLPENSKELIPVPNVRRHWVIEYSPSTISVFIDGIKVMTSKTPAIIASQKKFQISSEVFAYTTGKEWDFDDPKIKPTTTIFHWDNFGFSGPTPTTVVHNYIDGGIDGTIPQLATGSVDHPALHGNRATKVPIPDSIGTPSQARLMFTLNQLGNYQYTWSSSDSIVVNGVKYAFPDPNKNVPAPALNPISSAYTPHSTGIIINPTDLKTGINDIQFNLNSDIINAHIELEYPNGTEPSYTQPQNVFTSIPYNSFIIPKNVFNDSYIFIEQDMGLKIEAGNTIGQPTPTSTIVPTKQPTPTVNATPSIKPTLIPSGKSTIRIFAAGVPASGTYPKMKLQINGTNVKTWDSVKGNPLNRQFQLYEYVFSKKVSSSDVRVRFTNAGTKSGKQRALYVDKIEIDGEVYQSEAPTVLSTGVWSPENGCGTGRKLSEILICNGYFQY